MRHAEWNTWEHGRVTTRGRGFLEICDVREVEFAEAVEDGSGTGSAEEDGVGDESKETVGDEACADSEAEVALVADEGAWPGKS